MIAILQAFDLFHGHDRGHDHGHGHVGQGVGKSEDENEREDERGDAKNEGVHENVNEGVAACADDYYCHGHHDLDPALDPARGRGRTEKMSPPTTTTGESGASADESRNANEMTEMAMKNAYWLVHDAGVVTSHAVHRQCVEVNVVS